MTRMKFSFSSPQIRLLVVATLSALVGTGCDQSAAQAARSDEPAIPLAPPSTAPPSDAAVQAAAPGSLEQMNAQPSYEEEAFSLSMTGPAVAKVGEAVTYTVTLTAKSGFKVNDEYPVKFQFAAANGVAPQKEVIRKEDAQVEKNKVVIPAEVILSTAGEHVVQGKLSFSVCTDDRCLIEKRDLGLSITAS